MLPTTLSHPAGILLVGAGQDREGTCDMTCMNGTAEQLTIASQTRDTIRRKNPKEQGLIGLGAAIAWFTEHGYDVLLPLNDSQKYDLVVEDDTGTLLRVQVKTATHVTEVGSFYVSLATNGGNRSRNTQEKFDPAHYELLFVLTDGRERYLIPSHAIEAKYGINVGSKWRSYRLL